MDDFFAILDITRCPVPDRSILDQKFKTLGAKLHPDQPEGTQEAFTQLNDAYQTLRQPATAIRHYVGLEFPDLEIPKMDSPPAALGDLWMKVGAVMRELAAVSEKKQNASTALSKALLAGEETAAQEAAEPLQQELQTLITETHDHLAQLSPPFDPAEILQISGTLKYLDRWQSQIQEALLQLLL